MRRLGTLLLFLSLFTFVLTPHTGLSIGRKPKEGVPSEQPTVKQTQPKPNTREMQMATGEIHPINPDEEN